jgi:hypothetical protein
LGVGSEVAALGSFGAIVEALALSVKAGWNQTERDTPQLGNFIRRQK